MNIIEQTKKLFEEFINQNLYIRIAWCRFIAENPYILDFQNKDGMRVSYQNTIFLTKQIRHRIESIIGINGRTLERFKKKDGSNSYYDFKPNEFLIWSPSKDDKRYEILELYDVPQDPYYISNQSLRSLVSISRSFKQWFEENTDIYFSFYAINKGKINLSFLESILEKNQAIVTLIEEDAVRGKQEMIEFFEKNPDFKALYG